MRKFTITLLFTLVCLTWGTTWLAMRVVIETIPPIFATGMRFIFASPFLIFFALITKTPLLFPEKQRIFQCVVCVFYFALPFTLMIYGEAYVSSGLASVIFSTMPVAVLIASIFFLQEKPKLLQISGLIIALISLSGIILEEAKSNAGSQWQGILALVAAVIIHAIIYTQCKKRYCTVSVITFNALPCFFAGLILTAVGYFMEHPQVLNFSMQSVLSTLYLGVIGGFFGILCYFSLQKKSGVFHASLVFLVFPLIAISLENYIYGHAISLLSLLLTIPLAIGILFILVSQRSGR